ncbi:MAG: hypothetical protein IE932_02690 [Sphingopyxis terrae]|nr:hypothetical protein [Sphingopyxis terrae]
MGSGHNYRYTTTMPRYTNIEEVFLSPQYGNTGPKGWGFHLWSDLIDDEAPHRAVLEQFAEMYPKSGIHLPPYDRYEDYVECDAVWNSKPVWIYYETILSHLWMWSADREAVAEMRAALISVADRTSKIGR